jgi:processive 1,2-diacylglycerol beta-glucosyltransferase
METLPFGDRLHLTLPRVGGARYDSARMRVLILTASYGSGHNAAARSLAAVLAASGATVTVVDHFRDLVHPAFDRASRAAYAWILRRAPASWGLAYGIGDRLSSDSRWAFGVPCLGASRLGDLLEATAPDAVVSVHATPTVALSTLAREGRRIPPHTTVVTDFVAHSQWIAPSVDRYCVAAEEVKHEFVSRGIAPDRVVVTGVPVRAGFETPLDQLAARRSLDLSPDLPVVLAMAGAQGSFGRLRDVAEALLDLRAPAQALVVSGHDTELAERIGRLTAGRPLRVFGFVDDVRPLMAAADLLVTKAGGMTLAEAMAAELPILTYGSLPGQERRNERFASRAGIALVARRRRELGRTLERALGEPRLLERLRQQIRLVRRPEATRHIAGLVLERALA